MANKKLPEWAYFKLLNQDAKAWTSKANICRPKLLKDYGEIVLQGPE